MADDYDEDYRGGEGRGESYLHREVNKLKSEVANLKSIVSAYSVALFGHPQDKSDSGIVGNVSETRTKMDELNDKIDKVIWGLFGILATGVIAVIVAIIEILANHSK